MVSNVLCMRIRDRIDKMMINELVMVKFMM
jgi:hypothetical protein